ncbi:FecR family protein [Sunxiuqinia elliptica]|uniref:FecR family protein n=1 Tax=Sunxiuqinia elliptica TaxID=655355 RepID=A0A4R6GP93_9BACT|nr:FecR family protein [Sunxiuqinia elliptica]TDN97091.1 FecR family protein [Sunxiuqinia elliptica]TDO60724.1 FecR family protein [Sunxiuqinia elliptica]
METSKYSRYTIEDFVLDPFFIKWIVSPEKKDELFWNKYQKEHPEQEKSIQKAIFIIQAIRSDKEVIPEKKLDQIHRLLIKQIRRRTTPIIHIFKYAAILLILTASSFYIYEKQQNNVFPSKKNIPISSNKGVLITTNGNRHEFTTDNTSIKQTAQNKLTINNDTIYNSKEEKQPQKELNQLIIPYGKRSKITLEDGTQIWLNSGSQLLYPSSFNSKTRKVYLKGEAFLQVAENKNKPFHVITPAIKVQVLGTTFNISAYNDDSFIETVLLHGKVNISTNKAFSDNIEMIPGERVRYIKNSKSMKKDHVNPNLYASWINGYLIFENTPIKDVSKKLERYYNTKIVIEQGLEQITFSGKLDLKNNLIDVFESISFTSSIKVIENKDFITIKP